MHHCVALRLTTALLLAALAVAAVPARADERTLDCASANYRYRYCRADTDNRVSLVRQRSFARCEFGRSWGYDSRGVWVDRGCSAEFRVGKGGGSGKEVAVGAAVAGAAIAAIIVASQHNKHKDEVPSWAVGNFRGYDARERTDVELRVSASGTVDGNAADTRITGHLKGERLEVGRFRFKVGRSGNGFTAVDEADNDHTIRFTSSGSGWGQ